MLVKIIFPFNIYLHGRYLAYMLNIPLNTYFKNILLLLSTIVRLVILGETGASSALGHVRHLAIFSM